jgi:hypothetical protein
MRSACLRRHQSENCAVNACERWRAILQGSAELSRVRRHREMIGVLIRRVIEARGLAEHDEEEEV